MQIRFLTLMLRFPNKADDCVMHWAVWEILSLWRAHQDLHRSLCLTEQHSTTPIPTHHAELKHCCLHLTAKGWRCCMVLAEWSSQADSSQEGRGTPRRVSPALVALYHFMPDEVSPGYQSPNHLGLQPVLPTLTLTHTGQRTQLSLCSTTQSTHIMYGLRFWLKLLWKHLHQTGHRASSLHLQNAWYKSRGTLTPAVWAGYRKTSDGAGRSCRQPQAWKATEHGDPPTGKGWGYGGLHLQSQTGLLHSFPIRTGEVSLVQG